MKSQSIAVAGGNGKLGKHIVKGLLEIKQRCSLTIVVLSRSPAPDISYAGSSAPVLDDYRIDTIILPLLRLAFTLPQENLLRAGLAFPSFRRFAPSEFAIDSDQEQGCLFFAYANKDTFEYTRLNCGIFLNYLGYGNRKPEGDKALGHLAHFPYIFDLSKRTADIPGDGGKHIVYTRTEDVGNFVAAATQLENWEEYMDMAGDVLTLNEVLHIAEDTCGSKFTVKYNSREDIVARMKPSPENVFENFFLKSLLVYIDGDCDVKRPFNLNELVDIKP
ncbi:hypothetical protein D9757_008529 [Collybiopsis confluens]|uniref:NmrA-like domain-containing protein n=1 Tax=Collybiopsis confluens TaxID=2823264 RepID=A0A8H5H3A6_9AGAR|nr:hypothetical protein D9757_008529 [Collybiopsis confluens]